ncbi:MFS transporter [Actinoplanes sp. TBRC 11911]|uniref:MFS transporter n=1 Tax=Actinoplanes sp. TBRC 11911 TaxID=2729386 RepID=UPI00145F1F12|nr:MFS transporter [Actinoplanes sp. TBRC 11911]NMO50528.1 MFS transporter [Actinoplanes sp. TBRC 11911]
MSVDAYDRKATYREVLAAPAFTGLFAGRSVAIVGNSLQIFALSVLVYSSTGSPLLSALAFGAGFLPQVFGGVLLGSLADRVGARSLILTGYALEALLSGVLGAFRMPVPVALLLVAAVACYMPVAYGASGRALASLLRGDAYVLGRSLFTIASSAAQLVGLACGGVLLAAMGARGALLASAVFGLLAVLVTVLTMPAMPAAGGDNRTGTMRAGLAGSMEVFADATVRRLFLLQWLPPAMCAGAESLLVAYAGTRHFPAATVSALMAAIPVGMVAGNFVLGRATPRRRLRAVPWLLAVLGLPFAFLPVRLPLLAAVALLVVAGVGTAYAIGLQRPFLDAVPEDRSGQAFALLSAGLMTVQGLAPVLLGGIAEVTAPGTAIGVAGVAVLLLIPAARPRKFLPRRASITIISDRAKDHGGSVSAVRDPAVDIGS